MISRKLAIFVVVISSCGSCQPTTTAGAGFTDVSPRQLVRSEAGYLYAVVPTCDLYPACAGSEIRAYRGTELLGATKYQLIDPVNSPRDGAVSTAAALDANGLIQVIWIARSGMVRSAAINTATDQWTSIRDIEDSNWTDFGQGDQGVALAVDAAGRAHAFWNRRIDTHLHIRHSVLVGRSWTAPETVDDVVLTDRGNAWHPTVAFAPDGTLWLAWLHGSGNYKPDGVIRVRELSPAGRWEASVPIPGGAMTGIDNGPSMLVTPDGVVHLAFGDTGNVATYWYRNASGWHGDRQPPQTRTHNPSLGPDGRGGVFLYAHGTVPANDLAGHGMDLYSMRLPPGATAGTVGIWGPWTRIFTGSFDSSVNARWAQFFNPYPALLDLAWWSDSYPNVLWIALNPG